MVFVCVYSTERWLLVGWLLVGVVSLFYVFTTYGTTYTLPYIIHNITAVIVAIYIQIS